MSASDSHPEYKLIYFNGRGLAELSRLLFVIAKIDFADERYSFQRNSDGSVVRPEWEANKENANWFPFAKMPVLLLKDGTSIAQSKAIERYISRKVGLLGSNEVEAALIDSVIEQLNDVRKAYSDAKWKQDEGVALKNFLSKDLAPFLNLFENWLNRRKSTTPFFVGERLSYADVALYYFTWILENGNDLEKSHIAEALKNTPKLVAVKNAVSQIPQVADYVAKRTVTPF